MPGACQSRAVTEPQREKALLKLDYSHQKRLSYQALLTSEARFFVRRKLHKKCGVFSAHKKVYDFFDTLKGRSTTVLRPLIFFFWFT